MKTIDDALELRRRIFGAFEIAELATDAQEQRDWLTIVVVGAGPTGVEIAGQVRELASRSAAPRLPHLRSRSPCASSSSTAARSRWPRSGTTCRGRRRASCDALGVELQMGTRVTGVDATGVDVTFADGSGDRIAARTVIWAAGVQASPLAGKLAAACGAQVDRAGRIEVLPDLTLPGHPEVFAVGDMTSLDGLPGVAEVAMQGSLHAAHTIGRRLRGLERGQAVPVPRPRERRHHRPVPGHLQLARDPAERLPGLGRVGVRAPRLPQRVRQPHHHPDALDPVDGGHSPGRAHVQRRAHRR